MPTRRRRISPFYQFIHQPEFFVALWLMIFGAEALHRRHAWGAILLLVAIVLGFRAWKKMKRKIADLRAEEPHIPAGSERAAIEPEAGLGLASVFGFLFLAVLLLVEFHPYVGAVLQDFTPYRIVSVESDAAPPVYPGEVVWGRVQSTRPRRGQVVMIWSRMRGMNERLVTVVATGGDTIRETRLVDWVERDLQDEPRFVDGVAVIPPPDFPLTIRPVPRDSLVVTGHVHPPGEPIEYEMIPPSRLHGVALAVVFPPSRWRRLP